MTQGQRVYWGWVRWGKYWKEKFGEIKTSKEESEEEEEYDVKDNPQGAKDC